MPKVETKSTDNRGEDNVSVIPFVKYFSNIVDIKNRHNRTKRNINELDDSSIFIRNRKVVKKLIRVEPIYKSAAAVASKSHHMNYYDPHDYLKLDFNKVEESQFIPSNVSITSPRRKRVIIKKKRRRIDSNTEDISVDEKETKDSQPRNENRRRVVVTKKRLLQKSISLNVDDVSIKPTKRIRLVKIKTRLRSHVTSTTENISTADVSKYDSSTENELVEDYHDGEESQLEPANGLDDEVVLDEKTAVTTNLPDYEPFFPELSDSLDDQILLLKTTVLSTVHLQTKTLTESKLRTYTYVVTTRVDNGDREHVTSTTEVRPHTKTITTTLASTEYTTLTLLDLDATHTRTLDAPVDTILADQIRGRLDRDNEPLTQSSRDRDAKALDEARYNLATRIMKNGVEVIVAGDKTTYPGGGGHHQDIKRILPSTAYKPITLRPSTLTNNVMMILPQEASNIESLSSSLYPNEFVTKTCLTTFTYLTTYLENGTTAVSSHEQVISNVATEERNTGKILPTPTMGITLTQYPNLAVGTFLTTYTYLNTILDGEQPLVVTSRRVVTNTVTAPDDYLSLLAPNIKGSVIKDINTYYSTINLEKTLYEGSQSHVIKTNEIVTQVVITESVPPKVLSIMTSYIALDVEDPEMDQSIDYTTTDIVKTYYATYTYQNIVVENGNTIVRNNVSVSTDVVTEKLFVHPKRTKVHTKDGATVIAKKKNNYKVDLENFSLEIYATKTYLTTFTYFTTLLQEDSNEKTMTVVSSHSRVVENVVTETVDPSSLDKKALTSLRKEFRDGTSTLVKVATIDGKKIEITAISKDFIKPTKVLPIAKTKMPENSENILIDPSIEPSDPNIITGSTIIFDSIDDPFAATTQVPTPSLKPGKFSRTAIKNTSGSLKSSQVVQNKSQGAGSSSKRKNNSKRNNNKSTITPSKQASVESTAKNDNNVEHKKKTNTKVSKQPVADLLGLGSINIKALTPVLNAMAGLIQTNLKANRRNGNDSIGTTTTEKILQEKHLDNNVLSKSNNPVEISNRSPIYIPVGDIEAAESQNIGTAVLIEGYVYDLKNYQHKVADQQIIAGKSAHASPLLNGGIPISPGEVITANSDVIVGKIGRIGPRIPSIPLSNPDEIGMKPPPPPQPSTIPWPNRQNQLSDQFTSSTQHIENPIVHAPNNDEYVGPPPPPQKQAGRPQNVVRGEKHKPNEYKHIPLNNIENGHGYEQQYPQQNILLDPNINNHFAKTEPRPIRFEENINNVVLLPKDTFNRYQPIPPPNDITISNHLPNLDLHTSLLNEPVAILPVVERSTEQTFLVNIQPSRIAFVNIPINQSTAFVYGRLPDQQQNGHYFDDPSPYPQPEFSGIENYQQNGAHILASVYNDIQNEQQVSVGHIAVGTRQQLQPININPPSVPIGIGHPLDINPSKPIQYNQINGVHVQSHVNNHDIKVHVPPLSFGMIHQGNDFNAHIIKHQPPSVQGPNVHNNPINSKPRPIPVNPSNNNNIHQNKYRVTNEIFPHRNNDFVRPFQRYPINNNNNINNRPIRLPPQQNQNRPNRPRPNNEISEFMNPPPIPTDHKNNNFKKPVQVQYNPDSLNNHKIHSHDQNGGSLATVENTFTEDHRYDDLTNEAGEVIQESNSRPLIPGQVPIEILKGKPTMKPDIIKAPAVNQIFGNRNTPIVKEPPPVRPFVGEQGIPINYNINLLNSYKTIPQQYYNNFTVNTISTTERNNKIQFPTNPPKYNSNDEVRYTTTEKYVYHVQNAAGNYNLQSASDKNPLTTLLQIDEQNHRFTYSDRPKVTSLPINTHVLTTNRPYNIYENINNLNSQTEQSFILTNYNTTLSPVLNFGNRDTIPTLSNMVTTSSSPRPTRNSTIYIPTTTNRIITPNMELNVGEITNLNYNLIKNATRHKLAPPEQPIQGLQAPIPPPNIKMQPPKIDVNTPSGNIHIVPIQQRPQPNFTQMDQDMAESSSTIPPFVPQPSESMTPPPTTYVTDEVLGMSPPPVTHRRPTLPQKQPEITTYKPIFSLELDPPKRMIPPENRYPSRVTTPYTFETPTTIRSTLLKPLRTRRPLTRRPVIYKATSSSTTTKRSTTRKQSYWNRPVTPLDFNLQRNRTRRPINRVTGSMPAVAEVTTEQNEDKPPQVQHNNDSSPVKKDTIQLSGSEVNHHTVSETTKSTLILVAPTTANIYTTATTPIDFKTGLHHSGNEIKIVDESSTQSTRKTNFTFLKETKVILPTRYITHTKTSTVTITKTTVVKSLGSPPSTLTILVTKTEKMTIVDTVTEFHTLVKPTSIVEVITTTVNQQSSLYPPNLSYGNSYPSNHQPTPTMKEQIIEPTIIETSVHDDEDDHLDEFVIHDTDDHLLEENKQQVPVQSNDNESFFVVMTDKNKGSIIKIPHAPPAAVEIPSEPYETQNRDEMINTNEVNRVLLGGILIASPPSLETPSAIPTLQKDKCMPECKASRNELCQKMEGHMRCVCRPGFARMFPDRPCKPTYTYTLKLALDKNGNDKLLYEDTLADTTSPNFIELASATHNGLDRMVMQSDLRDIYHGVNVLGYQPVSDSDGVYNTFNLQLSDNTDETRLTNVFKKYLRNNNYSLGGTDVFASKPLLNQFAANDFNECSDQHYHDCSNFAQCFNLRGTYTCSCKEGYADLSENILYPGRICSAELVGCEKCHYHGTCYSIGDEQTLCECFQWYAGENCQINLKVLLIALVTIGTILFTLLLICIIVTCARKKSTIHRNQTNGMSFLPPKPAVVHRRGGGGTMDRTAMINDTSSESGQSDANTLPYVQQQQPQRNIIPPPPPLGITLQQQIIGQRKAMNKTSSKKGLLKKNSSSIEHGGTTISFPDQKDRSLTVMIPRAKYHPAPVVQNALSGHAASNLVDKRKMSAASSNEAKLLSYLDAGPSPSKAAEQRKYSKASDSYNHNQHQHQYLNERGGSRKTSGALVSAGFEVSATVGCTNMGTLGTIATTCGTEADRSENATLIQKISHELLSCSGTQSQFNTLRNASIDENDDDTVSNWMDIAPRVMSISEARSYDETTIQPPMKTFRNDYNESKHSSQHHHDEANTMAERDLGSTFLLPHTHLYKADRGSDLSGFESL